VTAERIVAAGPHVKPFEQPPLLIDLAPTILAALGAPATIEHTGRVLHEVVGSEAKLSRGDGSKPAVAIPGMPGRDGESNVTDTEADEMEEHLRGLGYLE
jgi:arylsulfatase A-like enzyme